MEFVRRVLNANFRLSGTAAAQSVATIAADRSMPEGVRLEAAEDLLKWTDPPRLDRVTGEFRPIASRPATEAEAAVRGSIGGLLQGRETASFTGPLGLRSLPLVNKIAGANTRNKDDSEILISITPHIVRAPKVFLFDEPRAASRILCIALIVAGIAGLKLTAAE